MSETSCPGWPPPLPSLPPYPPCIRKRKTKVPPPPVEPKTSSYQDWWNEYLGETLKRAAGVPRVKKSAFYELTSRQRRELLPVKFPTKQDKLIWSIPMPDGSYPPNGLPIWERLYLDHPLPMLKAPPNALVFARQQIGKKLWKDTEGQEFILYDPQGYEVQFSYENVHDPHLTNYYQGKEIRGFLLNMGDANANGWGICTLRRFNQYRRYLRRVHISLVHKEMENQDIMEDELHKIKMYRHITKEMLEQCERKAMMEEAGAAIREALRQYRLNRVKRLMKNIRDKEKRIRKLYKRRAKEQEQRIKMGQKLQAEQELKKKISNEINRRKKIITLRRWHESDEKRKKILRKAAEEKAQQKAEKVRLRWQNKIYNQRKMFTAEDEHLELQAEIKKQNIELRNKNTEKIKKKQLEQFQELSQAGLRKKANEKRNREERKMTDAIMTTWLTCLNTEYDLETEIYRVKKSINSTMAELLSQDTEGSRQLGKLLSLPNVIRMWIFPKSKYPLNLWVFDFTGPDRFSIITLARNRIQREQIIPLQVSFAIEKILEITIEMWASKRLGYLLETISNELAGHGIRRLDEMRMRNKDIGVIQPMGNYKSKEPKGIIFKPDEEPEPSKSRRGEPSDSSRTTLAETEIKGEGQSTISKKETEGEKGDSGSEAIREITKGVIVNYVHFGPVEKFEYPVDEIEADLKPVSERPKTPMPSQQVLCEAGFSEEKLKDVLPTVSDVVNFREKYKFRKIFKNAAVHIFKRAISITERCYEPKTRIRAINKLIHLGDTERATMVRTLCSLIMNKPEKTMYECEEFEWISRALGREAINEVLKPPEFQRVQNDGVARTKIMFYKPRERSKRK